MENVATGGLQMRTYKRRLLENDTVDRTTRPATAGDKSAVLALINTVQPHVPWSPEHTTGNSLGALLDMPKYVLLNAMAF